MGAPNRDHVYAEAAPLLSRDVDDLAPGLRDGFNNALAACEMAGIKVTVLETYRPPEVEKMYYSIGRDTATGEIVDPPVVTNAHDGAECWHCYRAASDITYPDAATAIVVRIFARFGFAWGGDWPHFKDLPHFQSDRLPRTPTAIDQADFRAGRLGNVWERYNLGVD
jgi:peptidoglycan L-alanyl-D-glutamate endopeptidase CwlK